MADSKRLVIQKAITQQLETITVANGYQHDMSGRVFRGRSDFGSETTWPFIGIFEVRPDDNVNRADSSVQKDLWVLGIQGVIKSDTKHPTDPAQNLLADIRKAIGQVLKPDTPVNRNPLHMFGDLVVDMTVDGGVTFNPEELQGAAVCVLKVSIDLTEDLENPYEI